MAGIALPQLVRILSFKPAVDTRGWFVPPASEHMPGFFQVEVQGAGRYLFDLFSYLFISLQQ